MIGGTPFISSNPSMISCKPSSRGKITETPTLGGQPSQPKIIAGQKTVKKSDGVKKLGQSNFTRVKASMATVFDHPTKDKKIEVKK